FPIDKRKNAYQLLLKRVKAQALKVKPHKFGRRDLNLISLNLSQNQLLFVPDELCQFENLTSLDISNNQLASLPREIQNLAKLKDLRIDGNPLEIPPEILEKYNEPQAILNYYFSNLKNALNECKVLCVGQGS